ncbi:MAG: hypothetical protein ACREP9_09440, partial [Candidatus Dormibacteraceae bacterium]
ITSSSLLYVEARAALAAAMRAGRVPSETVSMTLHQLEISWEDVDEIDYGAILIKAAGDVAEFYALRGYDAMPLTSAMRVAADTFVTADRDLIRAARIHGLEVIDVSN